MWCYLKTFLGILLALWGLSALLTSATGCSTLQPSGFPAEFSQGARQVATLITDQGVLTKFIASLRGQIVEPGVLAYAGMLYVVGGKITGTSGQIDLAGEGTGSGALSPEGRAVILELAGPDAGEKIIDWLLARKAAAPAPLPAP